MRQSSRIWKVHWESQKKIRNFQVSIKIATRKPATDENKEQRKFEIFFYLLGVTSGCSEWILMFRWVNTSIFATRATASINYCFANRRNSLGTSAVDQPTSKLLYGIKMCKNMLKIKFMVLRFAREKRGENICWNSAQGGSLLKAVVVWSHLASKNILCRLLTIF